MGHSGGAFLQGSNCFYNDLESLQSDAKGLLEADRFSGELPEAAFVFFMHKVINSTFFTCVREMIRQYFSIMRKIL
jgi:hypothetical protein